MSSNKEREIKFRAWDKRRKKMLIPFTLWELFEDGEDFEYGSGSMFVNQKYDLFDREDYEFMQYTGLKDKNGKEIYTGDILGQVDTPQGVVTFSRGCFTGTYFEATTTSRGWGYAENWEEPIYLYLRKNIEVLGNVYENPELLETNE